MTVGQLILERRKAAQLTQAALGSAAKLSRTQIVNIEAGRSDVPLNTLGRIAAALDCSVRDLIPG